MYNTVDLFAGAGGITEGFRKQGQYRCVCATDFDEEAMRTFTYNHPSVPFLLKDIRELGYAELVGALGGGPQPIDVMTGGPPCQGFSLAGRRLADDPRNTLFREYIRIADALHPKVIFFENVVGLRSMQRGDVLAAIMAEFQEIGYRCEYRLVNAADFGVPQARLRFALIGVRGDGARISFPDPTHGAAGAPDAQTRLFPLSLRPYVTVWDALSDLPVLDQGEGDDEMRHAGRYRNRYQEARRGDRKPGTIYCHRATRHAEKIQYRYSLIPPGQSNAVLPPEIRTKKQNAFKLDPAQPSRTVTCNFRTDLIHPTMNRGLTVREAARLQSFDDDYRFFGNLTRKAKWLTQDDQVGNAVPPLLARAFAEHIAHFLLPQFS